MKTKILIVEDQFIEANNLKMILTNAGYEVCGIAPSVEEAMGLIELEKPDMVLLDIHLRGPKTGIDLARTLMNRNIAFVYLSANSNKQTLDAAKITNPYGFLVKPFRERDVLVMLEVALYRYHAEQKSIQHLKKPVLPSGTEQTGFKDMIGQSRAFMAVMDQVKVVARSETSVLILGESGTGKELVAKATHQLSDRRNKPFVVLNCAALPAELIESELFGHERGSFTGAYDKRVGKFELANGGTVFLDEIGELPLDLQSKFLRVLQEREVESIGGKRKSVDVRVIAATNRDLEREMANGRFRMDLYYRLNVFPVLLPPLRERQEDIALLANYFVDVFARRMNKNVKGIAAPALKSMLAYAWPGNIRELENIMERSVLLANAPMITHVSLPTDNNKDSQAAPGDQRIKTITENERDHILAALEKCGWKLYGTDGAAKMLDINPSTLLSRMKKLGITKKVATKDF
ncbi:sigma-54-dependent transcriptional regulator [Deminuibacter soli]|uniref:Sigma-54-dependent Fis family transcriptional regulator n=1 Tax=Deminuibacter soli TaxID=2291815 RepID=A0A3E1NE60_9BACT|nr:sigma-54 dependent transcriptional regulator [Deminuibacter soli]RFM26259.1 sigma-54-dependent Fis family transcriptional regulator [Deminuibacter soli]